MDAIAAPLITKSIDRLVFDRWQSFDLQLKQEAAVESCVEAEGIDGAGAEAGSFHRVLVWLGLVWTHRVGQEHPKSRSGPPADPVQSADIQVVLSRHFLSKNNRY